MTTLLVAGGQRCTARCYSATEPECTCICRGRNHGVGRERALAQTPDLVATADGPLVAVLELPLREARVCTGCRCPEPAAQGLKVYGDGLFCRACRERALVLVEV